MATSPAPRRMPAVFLGHGSPMNAIVPNRYAAAWRSLGERLPRPRAVLAVSAHWTTRGSAVTMAASPRTLHDFGGFPRALFEVSYPAPGDEALARRVAALLTPTPVHGATDWGLDHGSWSVLMHLYPAADVPVVQLSLDGTLSLAGHHALAARLAPLRDEGYLILGSGNVVHNLALADLRPDAAAQPWARAFDEAIATAVAAGDRDTLLDPGRLGEAATLSMPTPEHYLPLLYPLAVRRPDEEVEILLRNVEHGSISMTSVVVGAGDAPRPPAASPTRSSPEASR